MQRKDGARLEILNYGLDKIGVIGFAFNHLRIINDYKGREFADEFLKSVIDKRIESLNGKIGLYRIEGVKFLAIVNEENMITLKK